MNSERKDAVMAFGIFIPGAGVLPFAARTEEGVWATLGKLAGVTDFGIADFTRTAKATGFLIVPVEIRPIPEVTMTSDRTELDRPGEGE